MKPIQHHNRIARYIPDEPYTPRVQLEPVRDPSFSLLLNGGSWGW
jgi:hypothetical protein